MRKSGSLLAWGVIFFALTAWGEAQAGPWNQLSPQEQQILTPHKERWDQLSPDRQERLRREAERWQRMTPEERKQAEERYKRWQGLAPQEKEAIRQHYRDFRNLPPEEQERSAAVPNASRNCPPSNESNCASNGRRRARQSGGISGAAKQPQACRGIPRFAGHRAPTGSQLLPLFPFCPLPFALLISYPSPLPLFFFPLPLAPSRLSICGRCQPAPPPRVSWIRRKNRPRKKIGIPFSRGKGVLLR